MLRKLYKASSKVKKVYKVGGIFLLAFVLLTTTYWPNLFGEKSQTAEASLTSTDNQYAISIGPIAGNTGANYAFATLFNPSGSGKTAVVTRIRIGVDNIAAANYVGMTIRRISSASAGTQIVAGDIPKKNKYSPNSIMEVRHTNVTVGLSGSVDSRISSLTAPGAVGAYIGKDELVFGDNEKLILQPGEGVTLYQEAAGNTNHVVRLTVTWHEQTSAPSAGNEYMISMPKVELALTAGMVSNAFFNPLTSGKVAKIKRLSIDVDYDAAAIYTNQFAIYRITTSTNGTLLSAVNIPKKHSSTGDTAMQLRYTTGTTGSTFVTVTQVGGADAKLMNVAPGAVAGQPHSHMEFVFDSDDEYLIIKPGEGIALTNLDITADVDQINRMSIVWEEVAVASGPTAVDEYMMSVGKVNGNTTNPYNYITIFNPGGSGKNAIVKRLGIRVDAAAAAVYIPMSVFRITTASAGTLVSSADIPKKHASSSTPVVEIRHTNVTATLAGGTDSKIMDITTPGAVGQLIGHEDLVFENAEDMILQPGEGLVLRQTGVGDIDFRVKLLLEWKEQATLPTPLNQYVISAGPITGSATNPYNYISFFNTSGSGKVMVVNRVALRIDAAAAAVYVPIFIRRTSSHSAGTLIAASDIPKKHASSSNSVMSIRHTNVTAGLVGNSDSNLTSVITPGAVGSAAAPQISGYDEFIYNTNDKIILREGEGFVVRQEAVGSTGLRVKLLVEWDEENTAPASKDEYIASIGPVAGNTGEMYTYASIYNPAGSGKALVLKRLGLDMALVAAGVYGPMTIAKMSNATGGTLVDNANVLKKDTTSGTPIAELRHTGVSTSSIWSSSSRIMGRTSPAVLGQGFGFSEVVFANDHQLVLYEGEGLALYHELAQDGDLRSRMSVVWLEVVPPPSVSISSAYDEIFNYGGVASTSALLTVTDIDGVLTTTNKLRIPIATSSINMLWDTSITTPSYGGTGSGNVTNPVTYEGGGSVAVINVTTNFSAGQTLTISGLKLKSFNTATSSTPAYLGIFADGATDQSLNATTTQSAAIKGTLFLGNHTAGQVIDQWDTQTPTTSVHYRFGLGASGESISIATTTISLSSITGIDTSNFSFARLYFDANNDGYAGASTTAKAYLRPNFNKNTGLSAFGCAINYLCVDEDTTDDDSTFVNTAATLTTDETYTLVNSTTTGHISNVRVVNRMGLNGGTNYTANIRHMLNINAVNYKSNATTSITTTGYQNYSYDWVVNPATGLAWQWKDLDNLSSGIFFVGIAGTNSFRFTQSYVEVTYCTGDCQIGYDGTVFISGGSGYINFATSSAYYANSTGATATTSLLAVLSMTGLVSADTMTMSFASTQASSTGATSTKTITPTGSASNITHTFDISNTAPAITNHTFNSGNAINLIEGTYKWATSTMLITDDQFCTSITSVTAKAYLASTTNSGTLCAENDLNCYIGVGSTTAVSNCVATTTGDTCGASDTTVEYDCGFKFWYNTTPTDTGSWASSIWSVSATATDSGALTGTATNTSQLVEINTLSAFSISPTTISYGSLDPGTDSGSVNATTTITNTGNSDVDPRLSGTDMTSGPNTILVGQQQYLGLPFIYGAGTPLSAVATLLNLLLPAPTSTTTPVLDYVSWGLGVPAGKPAGSYTGTNTIQI